MKNICKSLCDNIMYIKIIDLLHNMILSADKNICITLCIKIVQLMQGHDKLDSLLESISIMSIIHPEILDTVPHRLQKLYINKRLEDSFGELFGFAFILCSNKSSMQVKLAGSCLGICHKINEDISEIILTYQKNDLIDYFIHNIDLFRKLSIQTNVHNDTLEQIYHDQIALFKQQIKLY